MKSTVFLSVLFAGVVASAVPTVSDVAMTQDAATRKVTIGYTLAGDAAIITVDILTNGVSIGAKNLTHFSGDVFRKVTGAGGHTMQWRPDYAFQPGFDIVGNEVTAVVKAWTEADPPDVMVVELCGRCVKRYYEDVEQLPGGLMDNETYRTTSMVMKRIRAAGQSILFGIDHDLWNASLAQTRWPLRQVFMDGDYYMGVFEVTGAQMITGINNHWEYNRHYSDQTWQSEHQDWVNDWRMRPCSLYTIRALRGVKPPARVDASYNDGLGLFQKRTGLYFDLPTAAQWEFAARAGFSSYFLGRGDCPLPIQTTQDAPDESGVLKRIAVYGANANGNPARVGSKEANAFGLYDMFGNVAECCLDERLSDMKEQDRDGAPSVDSDYNVGKQDALREYQALGGKFGDVTGNVNHYARNSSYWDSPLAQSGYSYRFVVPIR